MYRCRLKHELDELAMLPEQRRKKAWRDGRVADRIFGHAACGIEEEREKSPLGSAVKVGE